MKGTASVANPEAIRVRLTVEMTYGDAKRLLEQIDAGKHPSWEFRSVLAQALGETVEHVATAQEVTT